MDDSKSVVRVKIKLTMRENSMCGISMPEVLCRQVEIVALLRSFRKKNVTHIHKRAYTHSHNQMKTNHRSGDPNAVSSMNA